MMNIQKIYNSSKQYKAKIKVLAGIANVEVEQTAIEPYRVDMDDWNGFLRSIPKPKRGQTYSKAEWSEIQGLFYSLANMNKTYEVSDNIWIKRIAKKLHEYKLEVRNKLIDLIGAKYFKRIFIVSFMQHYNDRVDNKELNEMLHKYFPNDYKKTLSRFQEINFNINAISERPLHFIRQYVNGSDDDKKIEHTYNEFLKSTMYHQHSYINGFLDYTNPLLSSKNEVLCQYGDCLFARPENRTYENVIKSIDDFVEYSEKFVNDGVKDLFELRIYDGSMRLDDWLNYVRAKSFNSSIKTAIMEYQYGIDRRNSRGLIGLENEGEDYE